MLRLRLKCPEPTAQSTYTKISNFICTWDVLPLCWHGRPAMKRRHGSSGQRTQRFRIVLVSGRIWGWGMTKSRYPRLPNFHGTGYNPLKTKSCPESQLPPLKPENVAFTEDSFSLSATARMQKTPEMGLIVGPRERSPVLVTDGNSNNQHELDGVRAGSVHVLHQPHRSQAITSQTLDSWWDCPLGIW